MSNVIDAGLERECATFLFQEAALLDRRKLEDWLALLNPAIDYRIPVRTTRGRGDGDGFSETAYFMKEDYSSLNLRVMKLKSKYAWSANPGTRTRHMIANIRPEAATADGQPVASNFAVYCYRGDATVPMVLTGERQDLLARVDGRWTLKRRLVLLDSTVLGLESFSIFI